MSDPITVSKDELADIGKGIGSLADQQKALMAKQDNLDATTKSALEDLTKVKESVANRETDLVTLQKSIKRVENMLTLERKAAFGDPIAKLMANEQNKAKIFCNIAQAMNRKGEYDGVIKAISEGSGLGAASVNQELIPEFYDTLANYGQYNTLTVRNLGTKTNLLPIKTARSIAQFILTEGNTASDDTNITGTTVTLTAQVIAVLLNASMQLIQDSFLDVGASVMQDFMEALAYRTDYAAFVAAGTSDGNHGGMTGAFNFATAITAGTGATTVSALVLNDFIKLINGVDSAVLSRKPEFWVSPAQLARIVGIKDSNGRSLFLTSIEAPSYGGLGSILGYKVNIVQVAPSVDGTSKQVCMFGDPGAYVVGIRSDAEFAASDDFKFDAYTRSFRGVARIGTKGRIATGLAVLSTSAT